MSGSMEQEGRDALRGHAAASAHDARAHCGGRVDADAIVRLLDNRRFVRHPVGIRFDASGLEPGEFAFPMPLGEHPSGGFCLFIHPQFEQRPETWPLLISYHIPSINYGDIVTHEEAELYGSTLLGMDIDAYYQSLCALADELGTGSGDGAGAPRDRS